MKEIVKKDWPYVLLLIIIVAFTILRILSFDKSFFSAHDEAYFLLKMQEAYDNSCIDGKSQWNLLVANWFRGFDLSQKFDSCLTSNILIWIANLYAAITACILFDKKKFIRYWAIISLIMFCPVAVMSYISTQSFLLCISICSFLIFCKVENQINKCIFAYLTGLSLGIAFFSMIPSALLSLTCFVALIIFLNKKDWHKLLLYLLAMFFGGMSALIYVHLFVCNISEIINEMLFTATYFTKNGNSYDGGSIMIGYLFFARNMLFVIISYVGAFYIANKTHNKTLGTLVYGVILIFYSYYQQKFATNLSVTNGMLLSSVAILPIMFEHYKISSSFNLQKCILGGFLLLYPMLATLGTNTGVTDRLGLYVYSWLFLYFYFDNKLESYVCRRIIIPILFLYSIPMVVQCRLPFQNSESYHFVSGSEKFAKVAITKYQYDYYNRVYTLMREYDFQSGKSVMFTTSYDYATLYATNAINSTNFHNINNFKAYKAKGMIQPDFLILCRMDSITLDKDLRNMNWGWPEDYDCYAIGNPEDPTIQAWYNIPDINNRNLYCRKSKRIKLCPDTTTSL